MGPAVEVSKIQRVCVCVCVCVREREREREREEEVKFDLGLFMLLSQTHRVKFIRPSRLSTAVQAPRGHEVLPMKFGITDEITDLPLEEADATFLVNC